MPEPQPELQIPETEQPNVLDQSIVVPDLRVSVITEDIADLPTQILELTPQKRPAQREEHEVSIITPYVVSTEVILANERRQRNGQGSWFSPPSLINLCFLTPFESVCVAPT